MKDGHKTPLLLENLDPDPIKQFGGWFKEAEQVELPMPNAMTLATANRQGKPSARIVLLKEVDARGFVFFTNYEGRKAQELHDNPFAALVFYWLPLSRQIRVEGAVELLESQASDQYFASRPRGHQIEAHASAQSQVIKDRAFLDNQFRNIEMKFSGEVVPRPQNWGGYRVVPEIIEFWQEGAHRLHDGGGNAPPHRRQGRDERLQAQGPLAWPARKPHQAL